MARDVRFTVRMSKAEHAMLKELEERHDRDRGAMVRWLVQLAYSAGDVVNRASTVRQLCVNDASAVRQFATDENKPPSVIIDENSGTVLDSKTGEKEKKKKSEDTRLAPLDVSKEILDYLNQVAGTNVQHNATSHRRLIRARLNDGHTVEDFRTVIDKKCKEWLGKPMQTNLKPSCLFRASNFDDYLGQLEPVEQRPLAFTDGEKRAARYNDRKATKYPTHKTRGQK